MHFFDTKIFKDYKQLRWRVTSECHQCKSSMELFRLTPTFSEIIYKCPHCNEKRKKKNTKNNMELYIEAASRAIEIAMESYANLGWNSKIGYYSWMRPIEGIPEWDYGPDPFVDSIAFNTLKLFDGEMVNE